MLATVLDPNQIIIVIGSVLVAVITAFSGVTIKQGRRLQRVDRKTEQLVYNGGESLRDDMYATKTSVSHLRETVDQILENQTGAITSAFRVLQELSAMKQAQMTADQRLTTFEHHTTQDLSLLKKELADLRRQVAAMTPTLDNIFSPGQAHLTPPRGVPQLPPPPE